MDEEDVGTSRDYKQASTDAFKRAAVRFGIAHELYAYGQNWVELDGDGKYARPIEDPAVVDARRNGGGTSVAAVSAGASAGAGDDAGASVAASPPRPRVILDDAACPKRGGRMWGTTGSPNETRVRLSCRLGQLPNTALN